jgi:hypothetical protein
VEELQEEHGATSFEDGVISAIPFTAKRERDTRFHLLQNDVINRLLLTAKRDSLLGLCHLRLGFPYVHDNG